MRHFDLAHPTAAELQAFAQGELDGEDFASIAEHVEWCNDCCQQLDSQPDNTLMALAREVATLPGNRTTDATNIRMSDQIPEALLEHPRYRVIEAIGKGGMGIVYRAEHRLMQRMVALKVVHPRLLCDQQAVERFEREVRFAARLSHPNIVVSYDADRAENLHFLVMEYVEGKTLDRWIADHGVVDFATACEWIRQAALGLQHASEQGMAHRDIKPHNLMVADDGQIRILDFGLSRLMTENSSLSASLEKINRDAADFNMSSNAQPSNPITDGIDPTAKNQGTYRADFETHPDVVLGTPDFIAPEQIVRSREADVRADIYSLGCTFYYLLTGRPPFRRLNVQEILRAHLQDSFPDITDLRADVPNSIVRVIQKMTEKRQEDRYAEPLEVADDLSRLIEVLRTPYQRTSSSDTLPQINIVPNKYLARSHEPKQTNSGNLKARRKTIAAGMLLATVLLASLWLLDSVGFIDIGRRQSHLLVLLPSRGLWFPDYQSLVDAARDNNVRLTFASPEERPSEVLLESIPGVAIPDIKLDESVRAADYDGIAFIGYDTSEFQPKGIAGHDVTRLLNEFQMQRKLLVALCAGQRVLAQHGALRGKAVSPAKSVRVDEIESEGAHRIEQSVVADGLVLTAAEAEFAADLLRQVKNSLSR